MRPSRSRRVQAQRKFAQGAFVPPNAAAAAPADNRRDNNQDASNVTRNHMSAPNLLDVISLHSAASSPERQGLHNQLTSQPVVLLERLRGRQSARGSSPQPSTSQRGTSQPRPIECQDASVSTTPVEGRKLRTSKKAKECKRVHAMSLRSRRLSKLELNKIIAQSCSPPRKVTSKRKRTSSDDEPLIYKIHRNKKALQTKHLMERTAVKESAPIVGILKQSAHMVTTPKQNAPKLSTPEHGFPEKTPKKRQRRTSSPDKCLKKQRLKKTTPEQSSPKQVTSQKRNSEPAPAIPELVVTVNVKADEDSALNRVTPDGCIIPDNPLDTVSMLAQENELAVDDMVAKEGALATESTCDVDGRMSTPGAPDLEIMVAKEDEVTLDVMVAKESMSATESDIDLDDFIAREGARAFDVMLASSDDELSLDEMVAKEGTLATGDMVAKGMLATDSTLDILGGAGARLAIPSVQAEPIEDEIIRLHFDDNSEDEPAEMDKVDNMAEELGISKFQEGSVNPCDPVVTSEVRREDAIDNVSGKRVDSPEPGPSGTQIQIEAYDSDTEEHEEFYSNRKMYLDKSIPERYLQEVFHGTCSNVEHVMRNRKLQKKTCLGASLRSDRDVMNASSELLDSCCKLCKPCLRIEKLMKISALVTQKIVSSKRINGQNNNAEDQESELVEKEQEEHEEPSDTTKARQNKDLFLLLPKHSRVMLKMGTNVYHGKKFFAVCFIPTCKSRKSVFFLEEKEHILDRIIETLSVGQLINDSAEGSIDNAQFRIELAEGRKEDTQDRIDNSEDRNESTVRRKASFENRRLSMSSDSELSDSSVTPEQETTNRVHHHKMIAAKRRLAKAKLMQDRMREEKEKEIAALEEQKQAEIARIMAEKNICVAEISRYQERFTLMQKEKEREFARLKMEIREKLRAEMEADRSMIAEVDGLARVLENEKDAKSMNPEDLEDKDFAQPGTSGLGPADGGVLVNAPVYHPTLEEFADPLIFYEKIWPEAVRFGICKIVPPPGWQPPPHKLEDDMRFDVTNQIISRMLSRWGPAARELCAIKLCLLQQNIPINRLPNVDGVEINLPKLYHMVQRHGGLEQVINRKRWGRVVDDMKFTKGANTERKLDQIYVKYLLPYDTLSHKERQEIMAKVEAAWRRKNQKLFDRALNPLYRQKLMLGLQEESDEESEDPDTLEALSESEDCIIKGSMISLNKFKKIATFAYESTFGHGSESGSPPTVKDIEEEYWRLVTHGAEHTSVNSASVDTGEEGYGFTKNKDEPYGSHPWNPKMVSQNRRNVLSYLDDIIGLNVPTLLLGMLFSTSCWHKDPHQITWMEYQLEGPPRIWYGLPETQTESFRRAVEILCPTSAQNKSLWLPTDIIMIPPDMLRQHNVTLSRVEQNPGEFVMVFPNAYTCCINTGYTVAESVYFAPPSWLKRLWTVFKETRESCEPTMFAMEHLLYNIARDPTADEEILQNAQPLFERMLHEEVTNRQMLQERGVSFVQELQSEEATPSTSSGKKKAKQYTPRDQEECEYCRATLFLSKVKGLTGRNTLLCLEHALMFLDTDKYRDADVSHVQVLVHVSVKELNTVNDNMKRRLGTQ